MQPMQEVAKEAERQSKELAEKLELMERIEELEKQVEGMAKEEEPATLRRQEMREVMELVTWKLKFKARIDKLEVENVRLRDNSKEAIERCQELEKEYDELSKVGEKVKKIESGEEERDEWIEAGWIWRLGRWGNLMR